MAKAYNVVPDKASGDVFTEAMWDDSIKTNINNLRVPPACSIARTAAQSINNNTDTLVAFTAGAEFDTESPSDPMFSSGTNTRITIQTAGIYIVTAAVKWAGNTTGVRYCTVRKNGTTIASSSTSNAAAFDVDLTASRALSFADNDYIDVNVYQNSGGALNLSWAYLAAVWIGQVS